MKSSYANGRIWAIIKAEVFWRSNKIDAFPKEKYDYCRFGDWAIGFDNDAFTKDLANGNGKLRHKVGLITADELTLAGTIYTDAQTSYLANSDSRWYDWSISPFVFNGSASEFNWGRSLGYSTVSSYSSYGGVGGLRPMVSLKAGTEVASGSGLATDPYIIE